ncbi:hypothetical protein [Oryzihumus sp.]
MTSFVARIIVGALVTGPVTGGLLGWCVVSGGEGSGGPGLESGIPPGLDVGLGAGLLLGALLGVGTAAVTARLLAREPQVATRRVAGQGALTTAVGTAGLALLALAADAVLTGGAGAAEVRFYLGFGLVVAVIATPVAFAVTHWSVRRLRAEQTAQAS